MAPSTKKPVTQAEVVPLQSLKSCLVNLPASLVAVLTNANTVCPSCCTSRAIADITLVCSESRGRVEFPTTSPTWPCQFRKARFLNPPLHICRMDWYAEQGQASTGRWKRWLGWKQGQHCTKRSEPADSGSCCYVRPSGGPD